MQRRVAFPNVLVAGHQAWQTDEVSALIRETTPASVTAFEKNQCLDDEVKIIQVRRFSTIKLP